MTSSPVRHRGFHTARQLGALGGDLAVRLASRLRLSPLVCTLLIAIALVTVAEFLGPMVSGTDTRLTREWILSTLATGYDQVVTHGRWWTLATWWIPAATARHLILSMLLLIGFGILVEPKTPRWMLVFGSLTSVTVGASIAVSLQWFGVANGFMLLSQGSGNRLVDPVSAAIAFVLVGSAWLQPVARRRVRVVLLVGSLMTLVYIGHPVSIARFATALVSLGVGMLAERARPATRPEREWRSSPAHQRRVLLAATLALIGLGPIVAVFAANRHSLAAPLLSMFGAGGDTAPASCNAWRVTTECAAQQGIVASGRLLDDAVSMLPWIIILIAAWGVWRGLRVAAWIGGVLSIVIAVLLVLYWFVVPSVAVPGVTQDLVPAEISAPPELAAGRVATEILVQLVTIIVIHLVVGVALLSWQRSCPRHVDARRGRIASAVAIGIPSALILLHAFLAVSGADPESAQPTLWDFVVDLPHQVLPPALVAHDPSGPQLWSESADALALFLPALTWLSLAVATGIAVSRGRRTLRAIAQGDIRSHLRSGSASTLSAMVLWPGYDTWRDHASDACVSYRVERGVALALGGSYGASGDHREVDIVGRFAAWADAQGWIPVLYSAPDEVGRALARHGWSSLGVGEESIIPLAEWSTAGKKRQDIRTAINRAGREGVAVTWTTFDALTVAEAKELRALSQAWVGDKPLPEMGFTLGGFDELDDADTLLALARDAEGRLMAATSWLPVWRDGVLAGRTLDFMRRSEDSMNGIMEMLIGLAANRFREEGLEFLSLSAAPLASSVPVAGESHPDSRTIDRLLAELGARLEPLYGFRSLLSFKRKFQPEQRPLIMAYPDPLALPAIGLALSEAYLPGVSLGQAVRALRASGRR